MFILGLINMMLEWEELGERDELVLLLATRLSRVLEREARGVSGGTSAITSIIEEDRFLYLNIITKFILTHSADNNTLGLIKRKLRFDTKNKK